MRQALGKSETRVRQERDKRDTRETRVRKECDQRETRESTDGVLRRATRERGDLHGNDISNPVCSQQTKQTNNTSMQQ